MNEYHSLVRTSTHAYSHKFKKSNPFALKKILCYERSTNEQEQQFLWAACSLHTFYAHLPLPLFIPFIYNQMIAIQRTSASLGATAARSSATSRKNHRAASTVVRRGMSSHVTSMGRRTKNSFRLPAIAMPSPEVNERTQTITYNETGKWRENFDLASWAKEIREVRFSSLQFKRHPFPGW